MSIDGIVKIVPISVNEWIVVSPTGIYKYVSINTTKRLAKYKDRVYSPQCVDVNPPYIGISTFDGRNVIYRSSGRVNGHVYYIRSHKTRVHYNHVTSTAD